MRRIAGGALALAGAAVLLGGCAVSLQSLPKVGGAAPASYPIRAVFADVLNLPADAQVRIGAQVVGEVTAIGTQDFEADLTLAIHDDVRLPAGTTAQVRFDNPLGDEYVLLSEPASGPGPAAGAGGPFLRAGDTIGESRTSTAPSVEDTFGALSLVLNGGGLNQLQVIIHELNATFAGNQPQIRSFLSTIDRAVATVAGGRRAVDAALAAIDRLTRQLSAGRGVIGNSIKALAPAIAVLAGENSQLSRLLGALSNLGSVGTEVARESGQATVADLRDLVPLVQQLSTVTAQLGPDLRDLATFEADAPKLAPGAYLQVSAIVDVLLPAGAYEPSPTTAAGGTGSGAAGGRQAGAAGAAAVAGLLGSGLS